MLLAYLCVSVWGCVWVGQTAKVCTLLKCAGQDKLSHVCWAKQSSSTGINKVFGLYEMWGSKNLKRPNFLFREAVLRVPVKEE